MTLLTEFCITLFKTFVENTKVNNGKSQNYQSRLRTLKPSKYWKTKCPYFEDEDECTSVDIRYFNCLAFALYFSILNIRITLFLVCSFDFIYL